MQYAISIEGRSLIRTFLAGATKDAAVYEMSDEQAENSYKVTEKVCWFLKKHRIIFVL